ncbi:SAM-dependent methyltransferase [Actinocorallia populi]|uniref:SAM-dependent methyltransferase n=1 Tax=Actinocorallia populi TaxID=2079200 RepID=UPI000D0952DE|nr:SAM-dependent methyltransferase [Actinocorallia populi]
MTGSALASHSFGAPATLDLSVPNVARMSDHLLDGKDNFACDRLAVTELLRAAPELRALAASGRGFLMRAVASLAAEHGIDQFLDLGAGLPASPCTHEVAAGHAAGPCRVVYVDDDPVVTVHNRALLSGRPGVWAVQGDLRSPEVLVARLSSMEAVDFARPVGVLLGDVLPYLPDPAQTVRAFRNVMAAGGAVVLSHLSRDRADQGMVAAVEKIYARTGTGIAIRTDAQIAELFDGLAHAPETLDTRPDPTVPGLTCYAGVGWRVRGD